MSNFKSGSGNLDFGGSDEDESDESTTDTAETHDGDKDRDAESTSTEQATPASSERASSETESASGHPTSDREATTEPAAAGSTAEGYPYFIRRSNVGDERDTRLEIHVRDKVADQEAEFRNELADQLDVNEVSKTDAREFALLAAYHHPERVAELMRDEGFGTLN